jgi:hypothetical protein
MPFSVPCGVAEIASASLSAKAGAWLKTNKDKSIIKGTKTKMTFFDRILFMAILQGFNGVIIEFLSAAAGAAALALFPRHAGFGQFLGKLLLRDLSIPYPFDFGEQFVIQVYGRGLCIRPGLVFCEDYNVNFKVLCRASSGSGIVPSPASGRVVVDELYDCWHN